MSKTVTITWNIRDTAASGPNPLYSWEELLVERRTGSGAYSTLYTAAYSEITGTAPVVATQAATYKYQYVDVGVAEGTYNYKLSTRNKNTGEVYYTSTSPNVTVSGATEITIGFDELTVQEGLRGAPPTCNIIDLIESPGDYFNGGTTIAITGRSYFHLCGGRYAEYPDGDPPLRGPFATNYGLQFSSGMKLLQSGHSGVNFEGTYGAMPSQYMAIVPSNNAVINRAAGMQSPFKCMRATAFGSITIAAYSEINGGGTLLGFTVTSSGFSGWALMTVTWTGTAKSLQVSGVAANAIIDNLNFFLL